ncbi:calcineurin-like phosphoesterase family protein [Hoeflea marina]|uniref:Calcineurin-like phosphoesterase family protein n=1 Tax=Hoeflea marina TaxID=274592 RepID=A0A317PMQ1_9HYPH|nr:metallophosphoesterase [Hoeflea marina]PWW01803.1 calcineurin-like phosphoesterase family protein [Hoeflea marina]
MTHSPFRLAAVGAALTVFSPCPAWTAPAGPAPSPAGSVVAAWTQVVRGATGNTPAQPATELRFVIQKDVSSPDDIAVCANFAVAFTRQDGSSGVAAAPVPRPNPDAAAFPVALCTVAMMPDWTGAAVTAAGSTAPLDIWFENGSTGLQAVVPGPWLIGRQHRDDTGNPELRLASVGDTGCKGKVGGDPSSRDYQDCSGWRFAEIVASIAGQGRPGATTPDLVIHVGDYRYFWEPIAADPSPSPDTWSYWLRDFFQPARPALLKTPWAFSRGNHELCSPWYGSGWAYLLGPGSGTDCRSLDKAALWSFDAAPGGIDASGKSANSHRFVMIDTSADRDMATLKQNFIGAIALSDVPSVWWVTHIPGISLLHFGGRTHRGDSGIQSALQAALSGMAHGFCDSTRQPSCRPSTFLMGHQHLFQRIEFFENADPARPYVWPQQVIGGHGGVRQDNAGLRASPCGYDFGAHRSVGVDHTAIVWSDTRHGYVDWVRSAATIDENSGWRASPMLADGSRMTLAPASANPPSCR